VLISLNPAHLPTNLIVETRRARSPERNGIKLAEDDVDVARLRPVVVNDILWYRHRHRTSLMLSLKRYDSKIKRDIKKKEKKS